MPIVRPILAPRSARPVAAFLLIYLTLFLNVLLPGHTRGAVTTDGKHVAACCCGGGGSNPPPAVPSQRDRDHCALCDFAAHVTPPPVVDHRLPPLQLVARQPAVPSTGVPFVEPRPTYLGRGPPGTPA